MPPNHVPVCVVSSQPLRAWLESVPIATPLGVRLHQDVCPISTFLLERLILDP